MLVRWQYVPYSTELTSLTSSARASCMLPDPEFGSSRLPENHKSIEVTIVARKVCTVLDKGSFERDVVRRRRFRQILVYDRGMPVSVNVQTVHPRKLAAVRREVALGAVGSAWGPAVGKVWDFIRSQPGLWTHGHNIFLYHHPKQPGAPILCDFGVEVTRTFETAGEVYATETPGGEAVVAVHRGPYNRMNDAYNAIEKWMAANRRESAGHSWEIYGDPTPDPADTETTVVHLLK